MSLKKLFHIWDVFIREYLKTDDINIINDFEKRLNLMQHFQFIILYQKVNFQSLYLYI